MEPGEVFGFLGPNGAGKSTTMRVLLDLIRPTAGSASILGMDTRELSFEIRRRIGFLPGDLALYPKLTGSEMLDHLAELRGGVDGGLRDSLSERFGAELDRPVHELSTGNRQKIGLIQAFMHDPELLILDEPIAGLDPLVQKSFHALLAEVSSRGRTVFLSSHTLSEVERVTHRVAILREGRLVVVDEIEKLRGVAVQRLEIEFAAPPAPAEFEDLPGVREAKAEGNGGGCRRDCHPGDHERPVDGADLASVPAGDRAVVGPATTRSRTGWTSATWSSWRSLPLPSRSPRWSGSSAGTCGPEGHWPVPPGGRRRRLAARPASGAGPDRPRAQGRVDGARGQSLTMRVTRQKGASPAGSCPESMSFTRQSGSQHPCPARSSRTSLEAASSSASKRMRSCSRHQTR